MFPLFRAPLLVLFSVFLVFNSAQSAEKATAVEIHSGNTDLLPSGKEADGIIGDFLLSNGKVKAVIGHNSELRRANMSTFYGDDGTTAGCLYDLTLGSENV